MSLTDGEMCPCGGTIVRTPLRLGFWQWRCKDCGCREDQPMWRSVGPFTLGVLLRRPPWRWKECLRLWLDAVWPEFYIGLELFGLKVVSFNLMLHAEGWLELQLLGQRVSLYREAADV